MTIVDTVSLLNRFVATRQHTENLCKHLLLEDYHLQPTEDVSPPKWHLAHTTWFFEEFILAQFKDYQRVHSEYAFLFNSYYESVGTRWQRAARGDLSRPPVADIYAYRHQVNGAIERYFEQLSHPQRQLLELGLHHEQQHQELLLTDLKYSLGLNPMHPVYVPQTPPEHTEAEAMAAPVQWLNLPEGVYEVGYEGSEFAFDNELNRHKVYINPCEIASRPVSNREYLAFIETGGYQAFEHWLSDGWDWVQSEHIIAPLHWHKKSDGWHRYTLQGLIPLDLDAPVTHISYFEADAYARHRGLRLPTEFEWEVATQLYEPAPAEQNHTVEKNYWEPVPHTGFFGNVWEWTHSAYLTYPGFRQSPGAVGEYNGKFMNGQYVLRGGSCVTPLDHIRATYRNFFMPDKRWQFTGVRLVRHTH